MLVRISKIKITENAVFNIFTFKILAMFAYIHIIAQLFLTGTRLITPFTKIRKWTGPAAVHPVVTDWTIFNTSYKKNTLYKV